jgi:hypothetical protein
MELVSMLAALVFMTIFTIAALIREYSYEIRLMHQQMIHRFLGLLAVRKHLNNDE